MKLGLICQESTREEIINKCKHMGITFYNNPDIYLVEQGYENNHLPCFVFRRDELDKLIRVMETLTPKAQTNRIIGLEDETYHVIDVYDILHFEARSSYVICRTKKGEYKIKERLYEVEARLPDDQFIRTSRSFIVNIHKVSTIAPWFNRRLLLTFDDTEATVEVSKNYVTAFKTFLGMR
ncbi:LytTR family DNA-binding domain-containing protein [Brassicibacter mesophilus]|uniref:LytTR family DNA-binding domain-containing protein n=1 Tax=Brassicibacter mesophilus TaxID=745119 RepID=UPI003D216784